MRVNAVQIWLERKERKPDGAGGYEETWTPVGGSPFPGRVVRPQRNRQSAVDAAPGVVQVMPVTLVFEAGVDVRVNDRVTVGETVYQVEGVRCYLRTVQVDVRAVL